MPHTLNQASYDQLPYQNCIVPQTHPDHLATLGILHGMTPPAPEKCRILELGCADGANLIAMAQALPQCELLGIDFSSVAIAQGRKIIESVGLTNITLCHDDIQEVDFGSAQFDYIIVHGIYSWVAAPVRQRIFQICKKHLSAHGIVFLSYNTLPGWTETRAFRDMALYHVRSLKDAPARVAQAKTFLQFLSKSWSDTGATHYLALKNFCDSLRQTPDFYLGHDVLEVVNEPVYFHEFESQAAHHGLQFLSEAVSLKNISDLPGDIAAGIRENAQGDWIQMEQYFDFVTDRMFRCSLLCHDKVVLQREIKADRMCLLHVGTKCRPQSKSPDINSKKEEFFSCGEGVACSIQEPIGKAAMLYLSEMNPRSVPFSVLLLEARHRLQKSLSSPEDDAEVLTHELLKMHRQNIDFVKLQTSPREIHPPGDKPVASPLVRFMAERYETVVNLRQEHITMGRLNRHLVGLLDGSRDRATLKTDLEKWIREGGLGPPDSDKSIRAGIEENLESTLHAMAAQSLFMN